MTEKRNPFDFVDSVSYSKKDIWEDGKDSEYVPFLTNKALSYHADSLMDANIINGFPDLPVKMQYGFFLNTLRPRRRFAKWVKRDKDEVLTAIRNEYGMSIQHAKSALRLLSDDQIQAILAKKDTGGIKNA